MAILTKEELFNQIHSVVDKLDVDESVTFLENMTDTYNYMESLANGDGNDWKLKYEENDKAWRKRYTERFVHNPTINNYGYENDYGYPDVKEQTEEERADALKIDDLFKDKE